MKIMTWNIQNSGTISFNNPDISNIKHILDTVDKTNADIVVIQEYETEYQSVLIENGLTKLSYLYSTVCKEDAEATLRKRVLIASKAPLVSCEWPVDLIRYSRRNWNEVLLSDCGLRILGVHVPLAETTDQFGNKKNNRREKKAFLDVLYRKFADYKASDAPAVVLGDFNLHEEAVYKEYLPKFSSVLTEVTTKDATCGKHKFDYIYVNNPLKALIDTGKLFKPQSTPFSDHKYLCIEIDKL